MSGKAPVMPMVLRYLCFTIKIYLSFGVILDPDSFGPLVKLVVNHCLQFCVFVDFCTQHKRLETRGFSKLYLVVRLLPCT